MTTGAELHGRLMNKKPDRARRRSSSLYVWGYNNSGGLGTGSVARLTLPTPILVPEEIIDIQGGTDFTVALTSTGRLWSWGGNRFGQLGDGSNKTRLQPQRVQLPGDARVRSLSVGADHVLALSRHGSVFAWGRNTHAQLGKADAIDQRKPIRIAGLQVAHLATGVASSHAVTSTGAVLSWGRAIEGGDATAPSSQATPALFRLPHGQKAAMVDAGERHLVVLTRDGELFTFGVDPAGKPLPTRMPTSPSWGRITSISSGNHHTVALTRTGNVIAWGANYYGQLGTGDIVNRATPVLVRMPGRSRIVEVVAGGDSVLVRSRDHKLYSWGNGRFGQNGNGKTDDETRPHPVHLPQHALATGVHAGRYHNLVATAHRH